MSGTPVFQDQKDLRLWRRIRGEGIHRIMGLFTGGLPPLCDEVVSREGSVHPAILTELIDALGRSDTRPSRDLLERIVQRSRATDCTPSVAAARLLLAQGDHRGATEVLSLSARSGEVLNRALVSMEIAVAAGNPEAARDSALRAYQIDPSIPEPYAVLRDVDGTDWDQRQNIQIILDGGRPVNPPSEGRAQELYRIYHEWFRGSRSAATDLLAGSSHHRSGDPEFILASARIAADEGDWHSACRMYGGLVSSGGAPSFVVCEAAEALLASGDPLGALEMYGLAEQTSVRVMRGILRCHMEAGDMAEAMDSLRSYLDSEFTDLGDHIAAVSMLSGASMHAEAAGILSSLERMYPNDPGVLTCVSCTRSARGDVPGAMAAVSSAIRRDPGNVPARVQRARLLLMSGNPEAAERECNGALGRAPGDRGAETVLRDVLVELGRTGEAVELCRRLIEGDHSDTGSMSVLAELLASEGEPEGAEAVLRRSMKADPGLPNCVSAVRTLVAHGMYREALSVCRDVESMHPGDPMVRRLRGNAEYGLGNHLAASMAFLSAAEASPHDPEIWHSKGMADEARGDLESAADAYDRAILLDLGEPSYWISKSHIQERNGDMHGAVESLNRAMELDPGSIYAPVCKARILSSRSMYREALHFLDMAAEIEPGNVLLLRERICAMAEVGRYAEAMSLGESDPGAVSVPVVAIALAKCHLETGSTEGALSVLDASSESNPDSIHILRARAEVLAVGGDMDAALTVCDRLESMAPDDADVMRFVSKVNRMAGRTDVADRIDGTTGSDRPAPGVRRTDRSVPVEDATTLYAMASSLLAAGEYKGALRTVDRLIPMSPTNPSYSSLKARVLFSMGDYRSSATVTESALELSPNDPGLREVMGDLRVVLGDDRGAVSEYDTAVVYGADSADVHLKRGEAHERLGDTVRAAEDYRIVVSRDPSRVGVEERLVRMLIDRSEYATAEAHVANILHRDPFRVGAILLRAEIAVGRCDDEALLSTYNQFRRCPNPGAESTVQMVRLLESSGHRPEAGELMGTSGQTADNVVRRYAEKAIRRSCATHTPLDDPDLLTALGIEPDIAVRVSRYLSERPEYGPINPDTEEFARMEALSHDVIIGMGWRDLESDPVLPLERVFMEGRFRDVEDARRLVAYVFKVMHYDVGRRADPRLTRMSMDLPKGMTVYGIMEECGVGIYEARVIGSLVI